MSTPTKSKKPAAKKKAPARKPAPKSSPQPKSNPEDKIAKSALKLIDDAASILRKTVSEGAEVTVKTRETAQKRAHGMVSKAHDLLGDALNKGNSALHGLIGKPRK